MTGADGSIDKHSVSSGAQSMDNSDEDEDEDSDGAVNIIKQVNNQHQPDMSSKTESERVSSKIIEEQIQNNLNQRKKVK